MISPTNKSAALAQEMGGDFTEPLPILWLRYKITINTAHEAVMSSKSNHHLGRRSVESADKHGSMSPACGPDPGPPV